MTDNIAIGIDLGGTQIKGVLLREDGAVLHELLRPTNDRAVDALWKRGVLAMVKDLKPEGAGSIPIGISAPGLARSDHSCIDYMPGRLKGLEGLNWQGLLQEEKVLVLNDAKAALMAEYCHGAGKGKQNLILLTLGTGVGGAILIEGKLHRGLFNRAGHMGHMSLNPTGRSGIVNLMGTLEQAIGNASILERSLGRYHSTLDLLKAYHTQEPFASWLWLDSVRNLARGISSLVNIISPELVILSGGITQAAAALFEPLATFMDLYEWRPGGVVTPIVKARFGNSAGAVGAASFALMDA